MVVLATRVAAVMSERNAATMMDVRPNVDSGRMIDLLEFLVISSDQSVLRMELELDSLYIFMEAKDCYDHK
jgi:hypothetical protein